MKKIMKMFFALICVLLLCLYGSEQVYADYEDVPIPDMIEPYIPI